MSLSKQKNSIPRELSTPGFLNQLVDNDNTSYTQDFLKHAVGLLKTNPEPDDLKLVGRILKEVTLGLEVFKPYKARRKVSMFGSARTPEDHPNYKQAFDCAKALSDNGFMVITGAGGGIMQAANEGAGFEDSFGVNIDLPFEQGANHVVTNSPRHFECKYFFTRKLFFLKESDAVILSPGGFGTLDEAFETLTLLQTGRNPPIPVVLLEAPGDDYWGPFITSWTRRLINDQYINPEDIGLIFHTDSCQQAMDRITKYYKHFHSFRYVEKDIELRLHHILPDAAVERLNAEFSDILKSGRIISVAHDPQDDFQPHLPRLRMHLNQSKFSVLMPMVYRIGALADQYADGNTDDISHVAKR